MGKRFEGPLRGVAGAVPVAFRILRDLTAAFEDGLTTRLGVLASSW